MGKWTGNQELVIRGFSLGRIESGRVRFRFESISIFGEFVLVESVQVLSNLEFEVFETVNLWNFVRKPGFRTKCVSKPGLQQLIN